MSGILFKFKYENKSELRPWNIFKLKTINLWTLQKSKQSGA